MSKYKFPERKNTTKKEGAKVLMGGQRPSGFNKGY